jgi:hypothetical protein
MFEVQTQTVGYRLCALEPTNQPNNHIFIQQLISRMDPENLSPQPETKAHY